MSKRVLLLAFHFPPLAGTSGVQRALSMAKYLPDHGWQPIVLTASRSAYERTADDLVDELPGDLPVSRALALDSARHLAIMGKYPDWFARPDRWISWWPFAVFTGLRLIRKFRPQVMWSTYPIATAHMIGSSLHGRTKIPWVADFRDSMTEDSYPADERLRARFRRIERATVSNADFAVFTSPGTKAMYAERYPDEPETKWQLIRNGYDENAFTAAGRLPRPSADDRRITILHSGVIYPKERDPRCLFRAIANLARNGALSGKSIEFRLRATGHDEYLAQEIERLGIGNIVKLHGPTSYQEALAEMMTSSGLLLLQAASCNHQTPAKLYEYVRAGRPVLALTDAGGDTGLFIKNNNLGRVAPLDSQQQIEAAICDFLNDIESTPAPIPASLAQSLSRRAQVGEAARLFDQLARNVAQVRN